MARNFASRALYLAVALLLLLLVPVGTVRGQPADVPDGSGEAAAGGFRYDPATGRCLDASGAEGLNPADLAAILETGNADCINLSGRKLMQEIDDLGLLGTGFSDVSFRGANLQNTEFPAYGAPNWSTALHGADIRGASDAYGMPLEGIIDAFTHYDAACEVTTQPDGQLNVHCPPP